MRDKNRIKPLLKLIEEVWSKNYDMRLSQLLIIAAERGGWKDNCNIFNAEDDLLTDGLMKLSKEWTQ